MRTRVVGRRALLVEVPDAATAVGLAAWARDTRLPAGEIVPGAATVLFDDVEDVAALPGLLAGWSPGEQPAKGAEVRIEVRYDGPDLDFVAQAWGTDRDGVVERHTSVAFTSAFCGFAPGFAYLEGLPGELAVPRLDTPRPRVSAGSVGLAGSWCGIYPTASPGGWRVLGSTSAVLWDADREPPALLEPGTRVRFVAL